MPESSTLLFIFVGLAAGILSGIFGIGGGVVIVPALIYLGGFTQHRATGTSLAVLLPPIGIGAMWEYYRHDNVNMRAAIIIAAAVFAGGWLGAFGANRVSGPYLRLAFGVFSGIARHLPPVWSVPTSQLDVAQLEAAWWSG